MGEQLAKRPAVQHVSLAVVSLLSFRGAETDIQLHQEQRQSLLAVLDGFLRPAEWSAEGGMAAVVLLLDGSEREARRRLESLAEALASEPGLPICFGLASSSAAADAGQLLLQAESDWRDQCANVIFEG
jgi:hypothetical protein